MDALCRAVSRGQVETISHLIEDGADPNALNKKGLNALHLAASEGSAKVLSSLLDIPQANLNKPDANGWTPLIHAISSCGGDLTKIRLNMRPSQFWSLRISVMCIDRSITVVLGTKGCDANVPDCKGNTPLHWAATLNQPDIIGILTSRGAMINSHNASKETSLHTAVREGNEEAALELIRCGADIMARDDDGATALHLAVSGRMANVAAHILSNAMFQVPGCVDNDGNTPLHIACSEGLVGLTEKLEEAGFSRDSRNVQGETPVSLQERRQIWKREAEQNKFSARRDKEERKRRAAAEDMENTEVTRLCRDAGLPDRVISMFYKKKYRFVDEVFLELPDWTLRRIGLSAEEREQFRTATGEYVVQREKLARSLEAAEAREAAQKTFINRVVVISAILSFFIFVYFVLDIAVQSKLTN